MTRDEAHTLKARMKAVSDHVEKYLVEGERFVDAAEPSRYATTRLEVAATAAGLAFCKLAEALGPHGSGVKT
jgi:hypothetical protein